MPGFALLLRATPSSQGMHQPINPPLGLRLGAFSLTTHCFLRHAFLATAFWCYDCITGRGAGVLPQVFCVCFLRWEGIPSVILSTAHFLLHCAAPVRKRLLAPCLEAIAPWAMHHHHATRYAPHSAAHISHAVPSSKREGTHTGQKPCEPRAGHAAECSAEHSSSDQQSTKGARFLQVQGSDLERSSCAGPLRSWSRASC